MKSRNLTLKDPFIYESIIEMKIELNFYFHTSLWCLKRFEAPQRSVKIKILLNFFTLAGIGTLRVKVKVQNRQKFVLQIQKHKISCCRSG